MMTSNYSLKTLDGKKMVIVPVNNETAFVFHGYQCEMISNKGGIINENR